MPPLAFDQQDDKEHQFSDAGEYPFAVTAPTARISSLPAYSFMTWQTGFPHTTPLSCSSVATCATTPSLSRSSTVFFPLTRPGLPERRTTIRPALLSVLGGTFHTGPLWDVVVFDEESTSDEDEDGGVLSAFAVVVVTVVGAGLANNSNRLRTYALSARATGSPSFTKLRNSDLLSSGLPSGFRSGRRDTGGAPNVTQWTRLKRPVRAFSSDRAGPVAEESMCAYRSAATAPPAEWPVMRRE
ncbi:hypothetical protein VSDG_07844 [Cytospora chrysosperma]|uniref:Uncharacterized protein n=1 Tax=Cytospora chrysosperma TaxID=252740 RepID=A0A423VJD1_CYTCH|nr:hypothetical protein VSDG_07844 [Valsa sordida]